MSDLNETKLGQASRLYNGIKEAQENGAREIVIRASDFDAIKQALYTRWRHYYDVKCKLGEDHFVDEIER